MKEELKESTFGVKDINQILNNSENQNLSLLNNTNPFSNQNKENENFNN